MDALWQRVGNESLTNRVCLRGGEPAKFIQQSQCVQHSRVDANAHGRVARLDALQC